MLADDNAIVITAQDAHEVLSRLEQKIDALTDLCSPSDQFLTTKEASAQFKVSVRELRRWTDRKVFAEHALPFYRYGRSYKFRRSDIESFIQKFRVEGEGEVLHTTPRKRRRRE